ncbi:MAG TPA: hypothetical protein VGM47_00830 [Gammaproteobacteria bacterium]|jgi:hypothetical protein
MLAGTLQQPVLDHSRRHDRRRRAEMLPQSRPRAAAPTAADYIAAYPCTRMHGAAFEAEFYPAADEMF